MKHTFHRSDNFSQCSHKERTHKKTTNAAHQPANEFSLLLTSFQLPFLKRAKGKIPLLPPKRSVWLCLQWSKQFILGLIKK